jgi:general secretion pathway protein M
MKEKWDSLQPRERIMVSIAGGVLCLFLLYQFLFAPIHHGLSSLRTTVVQDQELLTWMHMTANKIQQLQKNSAPQRPIMAGTLLSKIDDSIRKSTIAGNVSVLQQGNNNTVEAKFNKVSFDELTQWMINLRQEYGVDIQQVTVSKLTRRRYSRSECEF